jgi:hypothetical protein
VKSDSIRLIGGVQNRSRLNAAKKKETRHNIEGMLAARACRAPLRGFSFPPLAPTLESLERSRRTRRQRNPLTMLAFGSPGCKDEGVNVNNICGEIGMMIKEPRQDQTAVISLLSYGSVAWNRKCIAFSVTSKICRQTVELYTSSATDPYG